MNWRKVHFGSFWPLIFISVGIYLHQLNTVFQSSFTAADLFFAEEENIFPVILTRVFETDWKKNSTHSFFSSFVHCASTGEWSREVCFNTTTLTVGKTLIFPIGWLIFWLVTTIFERRFFQLQHTRSFDDGNTISSKDSLADWLSEWRSHSEKFLFSLPTTSRVDRYFF